MHGVDADRDRQGVVIPDTRPFRGIRATIAPLIAVFMLIEALALYTRFTASSLLDDSFMFTRYADRVLEDGRLALNPGGEQTYGLTSPAYLAVIIPLRALLPGDPVLPLLLAGAICGMAYLCLLTLLLLKIVGPGAAARRTTLFLVLFSIAYASGEIAAHFTSGMDTMFASAWLTLYMISFVQRPERTTMGRAAGTGLLGGAAFAVRPDLLVFTLCTPAVVMLASSGTERRRAILTLLVSCALVALLMLLGDRFLDSPLPLAFYAKAPGFYGGAFLEAYRLEAPKQLFVFLLSFPIAISAIIAACAVSPGGWLRALSPFMKGLLASTLLFTLYEMFFVTQIMPQSQRFFYPSLAPLAVLAAGSGAFLSGRLKGSLPPGELLRTGNGARLLSSAFFLALSFSIGPRVVDRISDLRHPPADGFHCFDLCAELEDCWSCYWPHLAEIARLPDDLVIASTEVGHLLAVEGELTVIDMTGLNETTIAHGGFSAEYLIERYDPDIIYMPHPDYLDMTLDLVGCSAFTERYILVDDPRGEYFLDLALNRTGRHFAELAAIAGLPR